MNTIPAEWAIDSRHVPALTAAVVRANPTAFDPGRRFAAATRGGSAGSGRTGSKLAVFDLNGPMEGRPSALGQYLGWLAMDSIANTFRDMLADRSVSAILFRINSPGGTVSGTRELADLIFRSRGVKPTIAVADSLAASAAFWVGTACERLYVTPSGDVGSIGVVTVHMSEAEALKKAGIEVNVIRSPDRKFEGNPFETLTPEALKHEQDVVATMHAEFLRAVARNRGMAEAYVAEHYGKGRTMNAAEALRVGAVDGIATFHDVAESILRGTIPGGTGPTAASDDWTRAARERQRARDAEWERAARQRNAARMEELKELTPRQPAVIRGLAIRFNEPSEPRRNPEDDYSRSREIIDPRCFDDTLNSADEVELRFDHGQRAFARRSDFSLTLHRISDGIYFTATIPDTPEGRHLVRQVKNGHCQMSFACTDEDAEHILHGRLGVVRHLKRAKLLEISVVAQGAYPGTQCYLDRDFAPAVPVIA